MLAIEKRCFIEVLGLRYRRAKKKAKGRVLDELCERLGVTRKWGIRLLSSRGAGRPRKPGKRGRPSEYHGAEFVRELRLVWKKTRYMCGRYLASAMPDWLPFIEEEMGTFSPETRHQLLGISAATIDRILKPYKAVRGISFTRSGGFREQIPIQESAWNIKQPGFAEVDTVAHCGGSMYGDFVNSLTLVDIATIWTEVRSIFGRGASGVVEQLSAIEEALPFAMLGYDADNGTEVLNQFILDYYRADRIKKGLPPVQVTRSRAYHKNDNAHVEQRNDCLPRQYLGYDRIEFPQLLPLLNYYWGEIVCPLRNHFYPALKLKGKVRIKSRTRRVYDAPITPYKRVMESEYVPEERKRAVMEIHSRLNPMTLVRQEAVIRARIDAAVKKFRAGVDASALLIVPQTGIKEDFKRTGTFG